MSDDIRIGEMPSLGVFTGDSALVGERAGSGLFTAGALIDYLATVFLPLGGIDTPVYMGAVNATRLNLGYPGTGAYPWTTLVDAAGNHLSSHSPGNYDYWDGTTKGWSWIRDNVALASLTAGGLTVPNGITAGQSISAGVQITAAGNLVSAGGACLTHSGFFEIGSQAGFYWDYTANRKYLQYQSGWYWSFNTVTGAIDWVGTPTGSAQVMLQLPGAGGMTLTMGEAYKPGGGPWAVYSDARIKDVQGDYTLGLDELLQLRPVNYRYKAGSGFHDLNQLFVGMIAQEVQAVVPSMVKETKGMINGQQVDDMLGLNTNELQYMMINAIKTLNERVTALEADTP